MVTIERQQFEQDLAQFVFISQSTSNPWKIVQASDTPNISYGVMVNFKKMKLDPGNTYGQDDSDPQSFVDGNFKLVKYEYQIIYSESYSVPILYFKASNSDGSQLKLEEIWSQIPRIYTNDLADPQEEWFAQMASMITQTEHPLLGTPFFMIHPCQTSQLLNNASKMSKHPQSVQNASYNTIITWLSTLGPVAGINLEPLYAEALEKMK